MGLGRFLLVLSILTILSGVAWNALGRPATGIDDSNITFTYAKHVAQGDGLVYSPGGERVEGFSSPLAVALAALLLACHLPLELGLATINLLLCALALGRSWGFVDAELARPLGPLLGSTSPAAPAARRFTLLGLLFVVWIVAHPDLILWSILSLLETGLWSAWVTLTFLCVLASVRGFTPKRARELGFLSALLIFTRPEGVAWALGAQSVVGYLELAKGRSAGQVGRVLLWPVASTIACALGLLAFRFHYFGLPLPNTYYAKVSPDVGANLLAGAHYLGSFLCDNLWNALGALAGLWALIRGFAPMRSGGRSPGNESFLRQVATGALLWLGLLLPVLEGGDYFSQFRFYQPLLVPLFFALAEGAAELYARWVGSAERRMGKLAFAATTILFYLASGAKWQGAYAQPISIEFQNGAKGRATAAYMESHLALLGGALPSVGVTAAGGIAYAYRGQVVDLMGLNNMQMARARNIQGGIQYHAAFDRTVFFAQLPDLVLPGLDAEPFQLYDPLGEHPYRKWEDIGHTWENRILKGLLVDHDFLGQYQFAIIGAPDPGAIFTAYVRVDYIEKLQAAHIPLRPIPAL